MKLRFLPFLGHSRAILSAPLFALGLFCPRAEAVQTPFTEEAVARGIDYFTFDSSAAGRGVAFCDIDGDLDPDFLCVGSTTGQVGVFENDGTGNFIERSATSGIPNLFGASSLVVGDVTGDGELDVYIGLFPGSNVLLQGAGDFTFTDITASAGVGDTGPTAGCSMSDIDGDGWLEIFSSNYTSGPTNLPNRLYKNLGGGVFTDIAPMLGLEHPSSLTWQAVFFDADLDGDSDLFLSNDKCNGPTDFSNYFLRNDGGTLVDVSAATGADICIDSMGVAVGDWTENGFPDLYITNTNQPMGNPFLANTGAPNFSNQAAAQGIASGIWSWGTLLLDYDNDRELELHICNKAVADRFYERNGASTATEIGATLGLDLAGTSYCSATADVDLDGDLDLVVQAAPLPTPRQLRLFINHEGQLRNSARLHVVGADTNTSAIGARVRVRTGSDWQERQVLSGVSFKSSSDLIQHFGLGAATQMDEIEAYWPNSVTPRILLGYAAGETWTILPPAMLGDADRDGDYDLLDAAAFAVRRNAASFEPGAEFADLDGDADVDAADEALFLARYALPQDDCNHNGVGDLDELFSGAADANSDGVLDECAPVGTPYCFGDGGANPGCTPCPCGNDAPAGSGGGCLNALGGSARLVARSGASVTTNQLRIEMFDASAQTFVVLASGNNALPNSASNPCFGLSTGIQSVVLDGLRCAGGGLLRHGSRPTDANGDTGVTTNGWGPPNGPMNGIAAQSAFTSGQTRRFQAFYREDPAQGCGRGQNTTNGLEVTFTP